MAWFKGYAAEAVTTRATRPFRAWSAAWCDSAQKLASVFCATKRLGMLGHTNSHLCPGSLLKWCAKNINWSVPRMHVSAGVCRRFLAHSQLLVRHFAACCPLRACRCAVTCASVLEAFTIKLPLQVDICKRACFESPQAWLDLICARFDDAGTAAPPPELWERVTVRLHLATHPALRSISHGLHIMRSTLDPVAVCPANCGTVGRQPMHTHHEPVLAPFT